MSSAAISFISSPNSLCLSHVSQSNRNSILFAAIPSCSFSSLKPPCLTGIFVRIPSGSFKKKPSFFTSSRPFSPVMKWQECTVKMEVDVPASVAYKCYSDREAIPNWMPFISSVKVLEDKPDLSRWSLRYKAFGRVLEYSWLARNMQLTVSYEVPQLLTPVASVLQPLLENLLKRGLDRFAKFVKASGSAR
ncbi:hypothetical protein DITRI_Ditri13aG0068100 [Diplodiscus trichospermus]